ncbi:MAG TPA: hypothetical protein VFE37_06970 [Chloroflexota bacterium]|nr:hypothetical protein [Chloroflexota bacterium]
MRERWMVDRARNRLIVAAAMLQTLQDRLRCGMLPPGQAGELCEPISRQIASALASVDEASASLRQPSPAQVVPMTPPSRATENAVALG